MQNNSLNFIPIDREIKLDPQGIMIIKYSKEGIIEYVNDYFVEITGLEVHEIVGNSIDVFKHSELPLTIFNLVMEHINSGKNINIVLKDQARDGRFFWFYTNFEFQKDNAGNVTSFVSNRRAAPRMILPEVERFYNKLLKIEQNTNLEIAKNYFEGFVEEQGMSYDDYLKVLIKRNNVGSTFPNQGFEPTKNKENQELFDKMFKK